MSCAEVTSFTPKTPPQKPKYVDPLLAAVGKVAAEAIGQSTAILRGVLVLSAAYLRTMPIRTPAIEPKSTTPEIDRELEGRGLVRQYYQIFAPVRVYSKESLDTCKRKNNQSNPRVDSFYSLKIWPGTWQDSPPAGLNYFPTKLPLELFIDNQGHFVQHGDKIQFEYQGTPIELMICNTTVDGQDFDTFEECLQSMIVLSQRIGHVRYLQEKKANGQAIEPLYRYVRPKND